MTAAASSRETVIATNGTRLNVATAGSGPPVLLVHGFPHTWRVWADVVPVLARSHRVIAPDLRGLGGSEREHGVTTPGTSPPTWPDCSMPWTSPWPRSSRSTPVRHRRSCSRSSTRIGCRGSS